MVSNVAHDNIGQIDVRLCLLNYSLTSRFCLHRKSRQELGFSFVVDTRKAVSKRRAVELIVEAMIFFQVSENH